VTSLSSSSFDAHYPRVQVQLVVDHDQLLHIQFVESHYLANTQARKIHEGLGLEKIQGMAPQLSASKLPAKLGTPRERSHGLGEGIHHQKPDIVTGSFVLSGRIAKPNDQHGSLLLLLCFGVFYLFFAGLGATTLIDDGSHSLLGVHYDSYPLRKRKCTGRDMLIQLYLGHVENNFHRHIYRKAAHGNGAHHQTLGSAHHDAVCTTCETNRNIHYGGEGSIDTDEIHVKKLTRNWVSKYILNENVLLCATVNGELTEAVSAPSTPKQVLHLFWVEGERLSPLLQTVYNCGN
jgi:hypothetical protein